MVEPNHPAKKIYDAHGIKTDEPTDAESLALKDAKLVNTWISDRLGARVVIWRMPDGKTEHGILPCVHHLDQQLSTIGCSWAWTIDAEGKAMQLLAQHLSHHMFKAYCLTGTFIETSKRSGVVYMFRRLRPTVAMRGDRVGQMRILASLCQHPIGYYSGSFAGSMCPTDDVLAHLLMMRADEHFFWKRSNQHPSNSPLAGL